MLVSMLYYCPIEERGEKWDLISSAGLSSPKIILTLLVEAITIYVQVSIIKVGKPSFEGLLARTRSVILF